MSVVFDSVDGICEYLIDNPKHNEGYRRVVDIDVSHSLGAFLIFHEYIEYICPTKLNDESDDYNYKTTEGGYEEFSKKEESPITYG